MAALVVASYLSGAVMTLVVPAAVLIIVAVWYVRVWGGDMGQP